MILWFAARRPPWSFLDLRSVDVMQALVCLVLSKRGVTVEGVVRVLEEHEALGRVGGRAYVESHVIPGQELDGARARVRETFVPVERETVVVLARRGLGDEPQSAP